MKKKLALLLAMLMLAAMIAGCANPLKELVGTWQAETPVDETDTKENLEYLNFYDDEIALLDLGGATFTHEIIINEDGTYRLGYNEEQSTEDIRQYLVDCFVTLYENRKTISEYAGYADDLASTEEFIEWYATGFFDFTSGDEMLSEMTTAIHDLYPFDTNFETGSIVAVSNRIGFKAEGETEYSYAGYTLKKGDTLDALTVSFSDGDVTFYRHAS